MNRPKPEGYIESQYVGQYGEDGEDIAKQRASAYDDLVRQRAESLANFSKVTPESVLDIGCRGGHAAEYFYHKFPSARVVGVDVVPQFCKEAETRIDEVYCCDVHELPFKDKEFDYTFSSHTLEHCYNVQRAAKEMMRVTKRVLFLVVPLETPQKAAENKAHFYHTENPIEWLNIFNCPEFSLMYAVQSEHSDLIFMLVRGEEVHE